MLGCWNIGTKTTGLSLERRYLSGAHKTAVIDNELRRLQINIAMLQETRLEVSGTLSRSHAGKGNLSNQKAWR